MLDTARAPMMPGYRFGDYELDLLARRVLLGGLPLPIGSRTFDVLAELAAHAGEVVTKDELLQRVWPGLVVEENNLQVQVSKLRRLLGAEAIATVAGRGYQLILRAATDQGATTSPTTLLGEPPLERGAFIGREQELAACAQLLRGARMLTITAIGGCGKTRLALELARTLVPELADVSKFIDLAPLHEAGGVPVAIGRSLRVFEQPGAAMSEALVSAIGTRRTLLVLDNCEQVVGAIVPMIDQLLARCPRLRILATSRIATHHRVERVYALAPLQLPPRTTRADVMQSDAARLLVDRLQWADPSFEPDAISSATIADICCRLDGIPLALELAAARAKVLSLQEIHARLADRFLLLTRSPDVMQRHGTLLATIQWSHDQLEPAIQRRFRLISVVAGGWTLATAAALTGDDDSEFTMLDAIAQLVELSLVTVERRPGQETRYRFLESVRAFAQERLRDADEERIARTRHLHRFAAIVAEGCIDMHGAQQGAWLAQLDLERENLVLAHEWCVSVPEGPKLALVLTASTQGYWRSRGLIDLGHRLACEAVALARTLPPHHCHAQALFCAGELAYFLARHAQAQVFLAQSMDMARALGDPKQEVWSRFMLAIVCMALDRNDEARRHATMALKQARALDDGQTLNSAIMARGVVHLALGELMEAGALFEESLALARRRNAPINVGLSLINTAWVAIGRGLEDAARRALDEVLEVVQDIGHEAMGQMAIDVFVGLLALRGQWSDAAHFFGAAQASIDYTRQQRQPAIVRRLQPLIDTGRAQLDAHRFAKLEFEGRQLTHVEALRAVRQRLDGSP